MKKFVQLDGGVVTAYLETDDAPSKLPAGRAFAEVDEFPALLSTYDSATKRFTPPPAPPDFGATVGPRDFLLLFTADERKAIRRRAATDEDVADVIKLAETPQPIRLKHPTTLASLAVLAAKGLITSARVTEIQNAQP